MLYLLWFRYAAPRYSTTEIYRRYYEHFSAYNLNHHFCPVYLECNLPRRYLFYAQKDGHRESMAVHDGNGDDVEDRAKVLE